MHRNHSRDYTPSDRAACLAMFDANAPDFFARVERSDYERYLDEESAGYRVWLDGDRVVGACGLSFDADEADGRIRWILTTPGARGVGLGTTMMNAAIVEARARGLARIQIEASQRSEPFFARFGARSLDRIPEGWGPGLDRVSMELRLDAGA